MVSRIVIMILLLLTQSCSILGPSQPFELLDIHISNISSSQNKFSANVTFDNKLGRNVHILNVACMDNGHFIPSFVMQRLNNNQWIDYAGPGCPALDVGFITLTSFNQFSTTVAMLIDTALDNGTYRLQFDIREDDLSKQIPSTYLQSNIFIVSR
jgi:hypothetical protein